MVGVGGAVLVDVAIPGLGVEMSMAARAQRAAFEPATNVSQQVLREATGALGRADDQIHHIMTNKNWVSDATGGPWSPIFQEMASKAGMKLDDAANKVVVAGHKGPHPAEYHITVHSRLTRATEGLEGLPYADAFRAELSSLGAEMSHAGTYLNGLITR
jgi:filamentous hemagglutinin